MKKLAIVILVMFMLVGCATPTEQVDQRFAVYTAVAETMQSVPTEVEATDVPTSVPTIKPTIEPTVVPTPTPTIASVSILHECVPSDTKAERGKVIEITDGDTIQVDINGTIYKVRYIGMDTPEVGQPLAQEATDKNRELVYQKEVVLVKDVSEVDRYDRLLRYVFVNSTFVNEALVNDGLASAKDFPPDSACAIFLVNTQVKAIKAGIGLWVVVPTIVVIPTAVPVQPTAIAQPTAVPQPTNCNIKGNISSSGERIYHVPGGASYNRTVINLAAGERMFCTEAEALAAGWRKALR